MSQECKSCKTWTKAKSKITAEHKITKDHVKNASTTELQESSMRVICQRERAHSSQVRPVRYNETEGLKRVHS